MQKQLNVKELTDNEIRRLYEEIVIYKKTRGASPKSLLREYLPEENWTDTLLYISMCILCEYIERLTQ